MTKLKIINMVYESDLSIPKKIKTLKIVKNLSEDELREFDFLEEGVILKTLSLSIAAMIGVSTYE